MYDFKQMLSASETISELSESTADPVSVVITDEDGIDYRITDVKFDSESGIIEIQFNHDND